MAHKMTRRGSLDNMITYEHYCDAIADLNKIDPNEINLGTIALVVEGASGGLEVYMAKSDKSWKLIYGGISNDEEEEEG